MNTTTKPLFEETLNIVLECFDKYKHNRPLLPISCLNNYELIYNEQNDAENLVHDDNQIFAERATARYSARENSSRLSASTRTLPRVNGSRASTANDASVSTSSDVALPAVLETPFNKNIESTEGKESLRPLENETERERLIRLKTIRAKYTMKLPPSTRPFEPADHVGIKRSLSSTAAFTTFQRKKRIDLKPLMINRKRNKYPPQYREKQKTLLRTGTDIEKKENTMIIEEDEREQQSDIIITSVMIEENVAEEPSNACEVH